MKIRHILLILTAFLGVALLVAVSVQIRNELLEYQTAQRMVASNAVREQLLLGTDALANERSQTYVRLIGWRGGEAKLESLDQVRRRVDSLLGAAEADLRASTTSLSNINTSLATLARLRTEIGSLRVQADAYLSPEAIQGGGELAARWFQ